ncbi:hypothetical protein R4Y45_04055 [Holzapfeliella sp. He02]|uniref:NADH dehydrogenase subunit 6 n=1 Tax=Holzapfeliella saturejae TaxID=3082953 RepID=A0ABU8SG88_9LACO
MDKKAKIVAGCSAILQVVVLIFSITLTVLMNLSDQQKFSGLSYDTLFQWSNILLVIQMFLLAITMISTAVLLENRKKKRA